MARDLGDRRDITVDGRDLEVEKVGRNRYSPWYVLHIEARGDTEDIPDHEFQRVLRPGGRSGLTDELLEEMLQSWSDHHPGVTVTGFSIDERFQARIGRPVAPIDEGSAENDHLCTDGGTDLSEFGVDVDEPEGDDGEAATEDDGRADDAEIDEYCHAITDDGERCENAISNMHSPPLCGPHYRADDIVTIDDVED